MKEVTTYFSSTNADLQSTTSWAVISRCFQSLFFVTYTRLSNLMNTSHKCRLFQIWNTYCCYFYSNVQQTNDSTPLLSTIYDFTDFIIPSTSVLSEALQHSSNEELPSLITLVKLLCTFYFIIFLSIQYYYSMKLCSYFKLRLTGTILFQMSSLCSHFQPVPNFKKSLFSHRGSRAQFLFFFLKMKLIKLNLNINKILYFLTSWGQRILSIHKSNITRVSNFRK